jgi:N-acetyl-anhydromuramoyl-L-alanine amidase
MTSSNDLGQFDPAYRQPQELPVFLLDIAGVCSGARQVPSSNCDERPADAQIGLLVIHNISLPPNQYGSDDVLDFFQNRLQVDRHPFFAEIAHMTVSAHFLVRRTGELIQFVPCELRAWHAGVSSWQGRERCNEFSIGIEVEGSDFEPFESVQYQVLARLTKAIFDQYGKLDIAGHSDIAPGRKTDPGPYFDWNRYEALIS